ncbi:unnamed protein product [Chironomus riparius]|uniref:Uncharacterized protein n=1 Tax=Chironomus riparius TaxID=315576 RepID=A0A9N9WTC6_9DIPT|nr:unnamed protein product [Chironomus riparius]
MGASSAVRAKSPTEQNDVEQQQQQDEQQPPRLNVQDIENNNNHIFVNPQERFITFVDECDLLNNNTTLINNNYLTVAYTPTSTTTTATALRINNSISDNNKKNKLQLQQQNQTALTNNRILSNSDGDVIGNSEKKKMQVKESPKKSPKKQNLNEKIVKETDKKKKKKEKPKAPRAPSGAGNAGGRGRGMAEQDQLMRRPRKKLKDKPEKHAYSGSSSKLYSKQHQNIESSSYRPLSS